MTLCGTLGLKQSLAEMKDITSTKKVSKLRRELREFYDDFLYRAASFIDDINPIYPLKRMVKHGVLLRSFRVTVKTLPASWCDSDHLILHTNFQILNDFVENECSKMADYCGIENTKTVKDKKLKGLLYLSAYINNPEIDDKRDVTWATGCKEIKDLYLWWNIERPCRKDPNEHTSSDDIHDTLWKYWGTPVKERSAFMKVNPDFKKNYAAWKKNCEESSALEELQRKEDEKHLIRLIKIRRFMWT